MQYLQQLDLHGGLVACLPLQVCAWAMEAANHLLLQNLTEVVDMAPSLAVGWEEVAPLLGLHFNVPHLHLVLGHVCPEGEQSGCKASAYLLPQARN